VGHGSWVIANGLWVIRRFPEIFLPQPKPFTPPNLPLATIHYTKTAGRPGNPAFLTFVAGLLRSNRGECPPFPPFWGPNSPRPPKGLIYRPVEPVASASLVLYSSTILFVTLTTLLTLQTDRTFWRGSGGSNRPPGQGVWGMSPKQPLPMPVQR
jgi:hypothetical protein